MDIGPDQILMDIGHEKILMNIGPDKILIALEMASQLLVKMIIYFCRYRSLHNNLQQTLSGYIILTHTMKSPISHFQKSTKSSGLKLNTQTS